MPTGEGHRGSAGLVSRTWEPTPAPRFGAVGSPPAAIPLAALVTAQRLATIRDQRPSPDRTAGWLSSVMGAWVRCARARR